MAIQKRLASVVLNEFREISFHFLNLQENSLDFLLKILIFSNKSGIFQKEERIDALIDKLAVVNEKLLGKSTKSADSDATPSTAFLHIKFAFVSYFKEGWMADETVRRKFSNFC